MAMTVRTILCQRWCGSLIIIYRVIPSVLCTVLKLFMVVIDACIKDIDIHTTSIPNWVVEIVERQLRLVNSVKEPEQVFVLRACCYAFLLNVVNFRKAPNLSVYQASCDYYAVMHCIPPPMSV